MNKIIRKITIRRLMQFSAVHIPVTSDSVSFNQIIRDKFTADPAVLMHNDTVYLYTGYDEVPKKQARYVMNEWLCYSFALQ